MACLRSHSPILLNSPPTSAAMPTVCVLYPLGRQSWRPRQGTGTLIHFPGRSTLTYTSSSVREVEQGRDDISGATATNNHTHPHSFPLPSHSHANVLA